ncbi:hypothetical protein [Falsiroseomonas sp. E2-1-a4]|uniref:hypothetical protein n=1 Tax=Falsiroseomonas sp. E2-1-a4 TaxID=3239299 RepID=UPI003F370EAD
MAEMAIIAPKNQGAQPRDQMSHVSSNPDGKRRHQTKCKGIWRQAKREYACSTPQDRIRQGSGFCTRV